LLSVRTVRTLSLVVCALGIAGMIVTSILNHNGAAVTFGLITAVAVLCSMVAKAVAADTERRLGWPAGGGGSDTVASDTVASQTFASETLANLVEQQVQIVVDAGADEEAVRRLVGEAVRFGRTLGPRSGAAGPDGGGAFGSSTSDNASGSRRNPHAGNVQSHD
jgi:hypothetical protein